jgi:hypothetical protein
MKTALISMAWHSKIKRISLQHLTRSDGDLPGDLEAAFPQLLLRFDACLHGKGECVE